MNITWTIKQMKCLRQTEGKTNVVTEVHWKCSAVQQQDGEIYSASDFGVCEFVYRGGNFVEYKDLTPDDVLAWVWSSGVEKSDVEAKVKLKIADLINPPVVSLALPWSQA
jgi:hypothetical protein